MPKTLNFKSKRKPRLGLDSLKTKATPEQDREEQNRLFNKDKQAQLEAIQKEKERNGTANRKPRNSAKWIPTAKDMERIAYLSSRNLSQEHIAYMLNISPSTLEKAIRVENEIGKPLCVEADKDGNPPQGIAATIKKGRGAGVSIITNALFQSAEAGNLGAQCFYLKNAAQWKDHADVEISGKNGAPIAVTFNRLQKDF